MKLHKILIGAFFAFALSSMTTSCVDDWKFGDSFLEKAPGGDVTKDTIFNNAEYTRDFLWKTYSYMYYGLPFYWDGGVQVKMNGVFETLSDCWHSHNSWDDVNRLYYSKLTRQAIVESSAIPTRKYGRVYVLLIFSWRT